MEDKQNSKAKSNNSKDIDNNDKSPKKSKNQSSKTKDKYSSKNEIKSEDKKNEDDDYFVVPVKTIKRSNSIKLYKRHKKENERRNNLKNENSKDIKETKDKTGNIFDATEKYVSKRKSKNSKNNRGKKVAFLPNFVTIIDVESYKKFNEENTCKDPFENMEIVNGHINIKKINENPDNKEKVLCSCGIF
jgi:hypothetical protein